MEDEGEGELMTGKLEQNRIFILIASATLVIVSLSGCTEEAPKELSKTQESPKAAEVAEIPRISEDGDTEKQIKLGGFSEEQKILSFDMTGYTKNGRKKWDIQGTSADIVSDTVILSDIEANAYSDDRTVMLKANSGRYDKKENSIRLEDNVIVTTSDGVNLAAEWLKWESETDVIRTDSFVEVEKGNL